jgi:hypothetical protein
MPQTHTSVPINRGPVLTKQEYVFSTIAGFLGLLLMIIRVRAASRAGLHRPVGARLQGMGDSFCRERNPTLASLISPLTFLVRPFELEGTARIAMIADSVGAVPGLWGRNSSADMVD